LGRFQINLTKQAPSRLLKLESKSQLQQRLKHREGILDIENKYKDLLVGIEDMISKELPD